MPDLNFEIIDTEVPPFAAVPTLLFKLRITSAPATNSIQSISLRIQIQIAVNHRRYSVEEQARLLELFGEPQRWSETLRPFLWTHASTVIPQFSGNIVADLPVSCTYDFEVATTKYFDALKDGEIPLHFLFSGTIFYANEEGHLQVEQVPWSKEAFYRLPVATWKRMIARYYPNSAWICLQKDVFDQLYQYKATHSLPTWEAVVTHLLHTSERSAHSLRNSTEPVKSLQGEAGDGEGYS
jgi:hypothetical protein